MNPPPRTAPLALRTRLARALRLSVVAALAPLAGSCGEDFSTQQALATQVVQALVAACPPSARDDADAHRRCADALTELTALRDVMNEPFLWGQQSRLQDYDLAGFHLTRFNPRVFRRMYLSLFFFPGGYTVEQRGERTVARVRVEFRNGLDDGAYPYPFWHSHNKWRDYQLAHEVALVFRGGRLEGMLRSAVRLLDRPREERAWDGQWRWQNGAQPAVTLYAQLFSPRNPHVTALDGAYRALEEAMRPHVCLSCHSPDNSSNMQQLTLLTYPNQTLEARHTLVGQLRGNLMPPAAEGRPAGIADAAERARLLELARAYERVADDALRAEGELREGAP